MKRTIALVLLPIVALSLFFWRAIYFGAVLPAKASVDLGYELVLPWKIQRYSVDISTDGNNYFWYLDRFAKSDGKVCNLVSVPLDVNNGNGKSENACIFKYMSFKKSSCMKREIFAARLEKSNQVVIVDKVSPYYGKRDQGSLPCTA